LVDNLTNEIVAGGIIIWICRSYYFLFFLILKPIFTILVRGESSQNKY
jgi:hypothetical protein